jgi:hypothetical protein
MRPSPDRDPLPLANQLFLEKSPLFTPEFSKISEKGRGNLARLAGTLTLEHVKGLKDVANQCSYSERERLMAEAMAAAVMADNTPVTDWMVAENYPHSYTVFPVFVAALAKNMDTLTKSLIDKAGGASWEAVVTLCFEKQKVGLLENYLHHGGQSSETMVRLVQTCLDQEYQEGLSLLSTTMGIPGSLAETGALALAQGKPQVTAWVIDCWVWECEPDVLQNLTWSMGMRLARYLPDRVPDLFDLLPVDLMGSMEWRRHGADKGDIHAIEALCTEQDKRKMERLLPQATTKGRTARL